MKLTTTSELNFFDAPVIDNNTVSVGEFFAGSGGVTHAMENIPGMKVKWVLNHDKTAIRTNVFHHKEIKHYWADVYAQDEQEMESVDFIWASIECTQHSRAKGGGEKNMGSYTMGYELIRYIKHLKPKIIGIENVPEFKKWAPVDATGKPDKNKTGEEFERWKKTIMDLGYDYSESIRNAADDGIPTRRVRYFAFFTLRNLNIEFAWPEHSHSKTGTYGKNKWIACKSFLNLDEEGRSIFGREKPLCENTLKRIAGGIRKFAPELHFIFQYYGTGENVQSIDKPLNTVTTKDRHVFVSYEKLKFIQDHCHQDSYHLLNEPLFTQTARENKQLITIEKKFIQDHCHNDHYNSTEDPLNPQLTWETKQMVSIKSNFIHKYYGGAWKNRKEQHHCQSLDEPIPTITTGDHNTIINTKATFISKQYNSNGNPGANNQSIDEPISSLTTEPKMQVIATHFVSSHNGNYGKPEKSNQSVMEPLNSITTHEKIQFITAYFSSSGNQGSQNQSIDAPINTILTGQNKKALITSDINLIDFDIKMRFLSVKELSLCSTFPGDYFTKEGLKLSTKDAIRLIGNAVPPLWAQKLIEPGVKILSQLKINNNIN